MRTALALLVLFSFPVPSMAAEAEEACKVDLGQGTVRTEPPLIAGDAAGERCLAEIARALSALPVLQGVTVAARLPDAVRAKKNTALEQAKHAAVILARNGIPETKLSAVAPPPRPSEPNTLAVTWTRTPPGLPLARIVQLQGEVRAGSAGAELLQATRADELFAWDELRTGAESAAELVLNDGTRVGMGSDAFLRLEPGARGSAARPFVLTLLSGSLNVQSSATPGAFELRVGETRALSVASRFRVSRHEGDRIALETLEGGVSLSNAGRDLLVEAGQAVSFSDALPDAARPTLSAPVIRAPLVGKIRTQTDFTWEVVEGAMGYRVELSRTADFIDVAKILQVTGSSAALHMEEGRWFWRVRAEDTDSLLGAPSKIHAVEVSSSPARLSSDR